MTYPRKLVCGRWWRTWRIPVNSSIINNPCFYRYDPGDHIAVYPENNHELVEKLGERLDVDLDQVMSLDSTDEFSNKKHPFPCPTTYRTALTHYIDITSPPRTNLLKDLAPYATDPTEKEFLVKISSNSIEGKVRCYVYHFFDQIYANCSFPLKAISHSSPSISPEPIQWLGCQRSASHNPHPRGHALPCSSYRPRTRAPPSSTVQILLYCLLAQS